MGASLGRAEGALAGGQAQSQISLGIQLKLFVESQILWIISGVLMEGRPGHRRIVCGETREALGGTVWYGAVSCRKTTGALSLAKRGAAGCHSNMEQLDVLAARSSWMS